MDFELKLNDDLPWSQKFRDYPCRLREERWYQFGHGWVSSKSFEYASNVISVLLYLRRFENHKEKYRDIDEVLYYFNSKGTEDKPALYLSRTGGPSYYKVNLEAGRLFDFRYYICREPYYPFNYWCELCELMPHMYQKTMDGNVTRFFSKFEVPIPYSYNVKSKSFVWKLSGKRVNVSDFWKFWETQYVDAMAKVKINP